MKQNSEDNGNNNFNLENEGSEKDQNKSGLDEKEIEKNTEEETSEESPAKEESEAANPEEEANKLNEMLAQEKEKALRSLAELENFKKRKLNELEAFKKFANDTFILELLPVLDSFDRACEHTTEEQIKSHSKKCKQKESMLDGFILIQKQFHNVLEKFGVKPIEAIGKPFDANLHQAVMQEEDKKAPSHTVLREIQKGYMLHDRLLRPSMVIVSK
ncbi:nucleotide exchange factor GrpE [Candidatus Margulisiibacteriota bacterium]